MILSNLQYPRFVPDQLLTSDNLDDLFTYLDDQSRMTRTNLIGIGIVCGLEVVTAADGKSIKITKGTGVTSEGYLVSIEETILTEYNKYDPATEDIYDKFKPLGSQAIKLWELHETAAVEGATKLDLTFLNGNGKDDDKKVVMLFVELLKEDNKNCNPESCDDKGITIKVNIKPLLVSKSDVAAFGLANGVGGVLFNAGYAKLEEMRMRRFDVVSTNIVTTGDLFTAYKKILTQKFLSDVEALLGKAWDQFKSVVGAEYGNVDPFQGLANAFAYVNNGSINAIQLRNLQYCYDYFSDLLAAYEEFRRTGMEILSTCCPDSDLFPRHLLLDLAIADTTKTYSDYRHYFNYSPLFQKKDLLGNLRSLFRRLALMLQNFEVPAPQGAQQNPDPFLRITPSLLDASPISAKAIPYYYKVVTPSVNPFYQVWNFDRTRTGAADKNLSYRAAEYSSRDFVTHPLSYDLEPNNFLRIEGHVGKSYTHVLKSIKQVIADNRLPIDVIALSLGMDSTGTQILDTKALLDIALQYELLREEVLCCLRKQLSYWGKLEVRSPAKGMAGPVYIKPAVFFAAAIDQNVMTPSHMVQVDTPMMFNADVMMKSNVQMDKMVASDATKSTAKPAASSSKQAPAKASAPAAPGAAAAPNSSNPPSGGAASSAGAASSGAQAAMSNKGEFLIRTLQTYSDQSLAANYLRFQEMGDFTFSRIPDPPSEFTASVISHHALIIMDEINSIALLMNADSLATLNVDSLAAHQDTLSQAIAKLGILVDGYIESQKPFFTIKAYVGESKAAQVDAIADAMPVMSDANANTVMLLLLNQTQEVTNNFILQLRRANQDLNVQQAILANFFTKLDKDGMMVPAQKVINYVPDPIYTDMKSRLQNFSCLCLLESFKKLQALLLKMIEEMKQLNLFYRFSKNHPGLQHKAGVPIGGTFIVVYHHKKGEKSPNTPDAVYEKISDEIPAGTVVADFYLPFLFYSNQPPIMYQVTDAEPDPVDVTLNLQPNPKTSTLNFSVGDDTAYAFSHTPTLGTLNNATDANGVSASGADDFVFTPSKVKAKLGTSAKLDLVFSYTKKAVNSPDLNVSVYSLPTASIGLTQTSNSVAPGSRLSFTATIANADGFKWTMTDSQGQSQVVSTTKDLANLSMDVEGVFTFNLLAIQSVTAASVISNSVSVTVKKVVLPVKTCGKLPDILVAYAGLGSLDQEMFPGWNKSFLDPQGVNSLFKSMADIAKQTDAQQLAFFNANHGSLGTVRSHILKWLELLATIILDEKGELNRMLRLLALELYRILTDLAMYIACLQAVDITKPDNSIFTFVAKSLQGTATAAGILALRANMTAQQQARLEMLNKDVLEENSRQTINNQLQAKPTYVKVLKKLLEILKG